MHERNRKRELFHHDESSRACTCQGRAAQFATNLSLRIKIARLAETRLFRFTFNREESDDRARTSDVSRNDPQSTYETKLTTAYC